MHKYYDWNLICELDLCELEELINMAKKQDKEHRLLPIWLISLITNKLKNEDTISFEKFIKLTNKEDNNYRNPNDIISEFLPVVEQDRRKEENNGKNI